MEIKTNLDMFKDLVEADGRDLLDVGCGDGRVVRALAELGAHVLGLEINPRQLADALSAKRVGDEWYLCAGGEHLPFPAGTFDLVVYFNSLHHVPVPQQGEALVEAERVLRPEGLVYVSEPLAEGGHFEVMQPAHDETSVRAAAYTAVQAAAGHGLVALGEYYHVNPVRYPSYEVFRNRVLAINPHRAQTVQELEHELRARFERLGRPADDGTVEFDQPMRVNLLRKAAA